MSGREDLLDLDGAAPWEATAGVRRWRPYRASLLAAGLVGVVAGIALNTSVHRTQPMPLDRIAATLRLRAVVFEDRPTAVLSLGLQNLGDRPAIARAVVLSGAGLEPTSAALARTLGPGATEEVTVAVPLRCTRDRGAGGRVRAVVTLGQDVAGPSGQAATSPAGATVTARATGPVAAAGGLCSAADDTLPYGWAEQPHTTDWSIEPDGALRVSLAGLGLDVSDLVGAQAGAVLLPFLPAPVAVRDGAVTVTLGEPTSPCRAAATGDVVPTGLQLLVLGREGLRYTYLPVGPAVAGWLIRWVTRSCPDSPGGPSAVRSGSAG